MRQNESAEGDAAAENAPVDRAALDRLQGDQQRAAHRDQRNDQPGQEHRLVGVDAGDPSGDTGDDEHAERQRQPPQHLHHAEFAIDLVLGARGAVRVLAVDDLGAHGVGDDVLDDDAEHAGEGAEPIEVFRAREGQPSARGAREEQQPRGDKSGPDEHVDAALRAEDRHGVDQLAEHHLHGPRQRRPNGQRGELGRRQRQRLLDPEALRHGDEAQRAVGEVDHQQRQVARPEGADRVEQRVLQLPPEIVPAPNLGGSHVRALRRLDAAI